MKLSVKRSLRNFSILLLPFMIMILINESVRQTVKENSYTIQGVSTINSDNRDTEKCTWVCHNDTVFCKENHVKYLNPFFFLTDLFYFGIIALLQLTGSYGLANIIFLVVLIPMIIWFFIYKSLNIQDKINQIKKVDE